MAFSRIRFCGNNFLENDGVTLSAASAMNGFPASNLLHPRRSKVTRTNGHFEVTSANKNIYINDGSDKTAAIAEGAYTSPDDLADAVQTALNDVSSSWTCSYSTSTYKFTIDRSSGTKTLRKSQTSNAAWSLLGYLGSSDEDAGEADEARNHTSERWTVDLGTAMAVTFFACIGPKSAPFSISATATAKLYASNVNSWASPALTVDLTVTPEGIFAFLGDDGADTTYRYWRFEFEDKTNTVGPQGFKLGHLYLGDYVSIAGRNVTPGGWSIYEEDPSVVIESEGGALFHDLRTKYRVFNGLLIDQIPQASRLELEQMFHNVGISKPFYFTIDPLLSQTASFTEWGGYVRFMDRPEFTHVIKNYFEMSLSLREAL